MRVRHFREEQTGNLRQRGCTEDAIPSGTYRVQLVTQVYWVDIVTFKVREHNNLSEFDDRDEDIATVVERENFFVSDR
jgi:hypothetical protein